MRHIRYIIQLPVNGCIDHSAGVLQAHTLTHSVAATAPAGIHQPYVHIRMLLQLFAQQLRIFGRMQRQEYPAEACGEGGLRLRDTYFRTGYLGSITGNKVVHGLLPRQFGNRR